MTRIFSLLVAAACVAVLSLASNSSAAEAVKPTLKRLDDRVRVEIGGELFTEFIFKGQPKPIAFPIFAPGQVPMTRSYPLEKGVPGESSDHVHHRSLWFTHGDVNGIDFWLEGKNAGKIVNKELAVADDKSSRAEIMTTNQWIDPKGKVQCTDTTTLVFGVMPSARTIDWETTIHASHGDVKFGDTKEGTLGIRTQESLRLDKGGKAINSEGATGGELWGQHASWVYYYGQVDGKPVGVAIFDHPENLRHPTTWHARDYGLVAANPFGLHHFQKKPQVAGDFLIKSGESQTFRYRLVFHAGTLSATQVAALYKTYADAETTVPRQK